MHHTARPDRTVGMHHWARLARCARGEHHVRQPVRITAIIGKIRIRGRQTSAIEGIRKQRQIQPPRIIWARHIGTVQNGGAVDQAQQLGHLNCGQLGRGRHRHNPRRDTAQIGNRKLNGIANAHHHHVTRSQTPRSQKPRHDLYRCRNLIIAPMHVLRRAGPQDGQGHFRRTATRLRQHILRHIERSRTGRQRLGSENRYHSSVATAQPEPLQGKACLSIAMT